MHIFFLTRCETLWYGGEIFRGNYKRKDLRLSSDAPEWSLLCFFFAWGNLWPPSIGPAAASQLKVSSVTEWGILNLVYCSWHILYFHSSKMIVIYTSSFNFVSYFTNSQAIVGFFATSILVLVLFTWGLERKDLHVISNWFSECVTLWELMRVLSFFLWCPGVAASGLLFLYAYLELLTIITLDGLISIEIQLVIKWQRCSVVSSN